MALEEEVVAGAGDAKARAHQASTFAELGVCKELVDACDAMGWKAPTRIQAEAIPCALQGRGVVALAQTGSGKTAAFALPILQALLERPQPFFACVLSPARELAIQIAEQFQALGSAIGLVCTVLVGGVDRVQQAISLAKRPHIIVATPGRLLDHLTDTKGFSLNKLKYLVLDEADKLLSVEFEKAVDDILEVIPKDRRTFLFSATMTRKVEKLQRTCLRNPIEVNVTSKYSTVDTLRQGFYFCPAKVKPFKAHQRGINSDGPQWAAHGTVKLHDCYLVHVLNKVRGSMIMIFLRTCDSTRPLALMLRNLGFQAVAMNGKMSQHKRLGALNRFKAKVCNILTCTDVASRGLDIQGVDVVINYDVPQNPKDYIHRVGRTARAGQSGYAVSLVNQYEAECFVMTEKLLGKKIMKHEVHKFEIDMLKPCISNAKRIAPMGSYSCKRPRTLQDDEDEVQDYGPTNRRSSFSGKRSKRQSCFPASRRLSFSRNR